MQPLKNVKTIVTLWEIKQIHKKTHTLKSKQKNRLLDGSSPRVVVCWHLAEGQSLGQENRGLILWPLSSHQWDCNIGSGHELITRYLSALIFSSINDNHSANSRLWRWVILNQLNLLNSGQHHSQVCFNKTEQAPSSLLWDWTNGYSGGWLVCP